MTFYSLSAYAKTVSKWQDEINFCDDLRIKWDWMKYKIREESITYSKLKAKERRNKIQEIESRLKICEEKIAESPTQENLANLESAKTEYEKEYDYIVRGSIIRSRATWFEQGERKSKYFFNLENRNKKKAAFESLFDQMKTRLLHSKAYSIKWRRDYCSGHYYE